MHFKNIARFNVYDTIEVLHCIRIKIHSKLYMRKHDFYVMENRVNFLLPIHSMKHMSVKVLK